MGVIFLSYFPHIPSYFSHPAYSFIFPSYFPHIPPFGRFKVMSLHNISSYLFPIFFVFLHIFYISFFIYLQHLGPKRGERGQNSRRARKFHMHPRAKARNYSKSHGGLWLVGIYHIHNNNSQLTSLDFGGRAHKRLVWFLEYKNIPSNSLYGLRKCRNTLQALTDLQQHINDTMFFYLQQAFPRVWRHC